MTFERQIQDTTETQADLLKVAILAVGGQGGGVLTNWIEHVARAEGYIVQATSVAGVAQRTGATIYYLEMAPASDNAPVFSLAPAGGADVVIAAELMEAGRAMTRGFVTPQRTTLIASTHRILSVSEKMVPGDGVLPPDEVLEAAKLLSRERIMFDMNAVAARNHSIISSALLGSLAASGALPFSREAFEAAIRAGGKAVETSLNSFAAAYEAAKSDSPESADEETRIATFGVSGPARQLREWTALEEAAAAHEMVEAGGRTGAVLVAC